MNSLQVYGGDEVNAIVIDYGTCQTNIGYAGDTHPTFLSLSRYGEFANGKRIYDETSMLLPRDNYTTRPLVSRGEIINWERTREHWEHAFQRMGISPQEHPLLLVESIWNSLENRKRSLELAFEMGFPAVSLISKPTCCAIAHGKPTALVVDIGHDTCSVSAVLDGMTLSKTTLVTPYAGKFLDAQIRAGTGINSDAFCKEFKETVAVVSDEERTMRSLEFGGKKYEFTDLRYTVGESLFSPHEYLLDGFAKTNGETSISAHNDYVPIKRTKNTSDTLLPDGSDANDETSQTGGLTDLVVRALMNNDVDIRASLAHNIVLTGGTSCIPGVSERLMSDLSARLPALKFRVLASGNLIERGYTSWLGGSILSSLGTFHQLWVGRAEYEEVGPERLLMERFK